MYYPPDTRSISGNATHWESTPGRGVVCTRRTIVCENSALHWQLSLVCGQRRRNLRHFRGGTDARRERLECTTTMKRADADRPATGRFTSATGPFGRQAEAVGFTHGADLFCYPLARVDLNCRLGRGGRQCGNGRFCGSQLAFVWLRCAEIGDETCHFPIQAERRRIARQQAQDSAVGGDSSSTG